MSYSAPGGSSAIEGKFSNWTQLYNVSVGAANDDIKFFIDEVNNLIYVFDDSATNQFSILNLLTGTVIQAAGAMNGNALSNNQSYAQSIQAKFIAVARSNTVVEIYSNGALLKTITIGGAGFQQLNMSASGKFLIIWDGANHLMYCYQGS